MKWTTDDDDFLKKNHGDLSLKQLSSHLNRSRTAVWHRARALGLTQKKHNDKSKFRTSKSDESYDEIITQLLPCMSYKACAEQIQKSRTFVRQRAKILGITANPPPKKLSETHKRVIASRIAKEITDQQRQFIIQNLKSIIKDESNI